MAKTDVVKLTVSEIGRMRTCKQRWGFEYRDRLKPKWAPRALTVGRAAHAGVEAMYRLLQDAQREGHGISLDEVREVVCRSMRMDLAEYVSKINEAIFDPEAEKRARMAGVDVDRLAEECELAEREAEGGVLRFVDTFAESDFEQFDIVEVEQTFDVPIVINGRTWPLARYVGRRDVLMREKMTGQLVLADHKFVAADASAYDLKFEQDPQLPGYVYALLAQRGPSESTGRAFFNIIRKSGPKEPGVNVDGTVSAAACDTTQAIYEAALTKQETVGFENTKKGSTIATPRTEKQIARLAQLPSSTRRWAARHEHYYSPEDVERWVRELATDVTAMRTLSKPDTFLPRNGASCTAPGALSCAYRMICAQDTPERRAQFFDVAEVRHVELVDEAAEDAR